MRSAIASSSAAVTSSVASSTRFTVSLIGRAGMTAGSVAAASNSRSSRSLLAPGRAASCTATCVASSGTDAIAFRTVSHRALRPPSTTCAPWKPSVAA
jgi:hypothetical protein